MRLKIALIVCVVLSLFLVLGSLLYVNKAYIKTDQVVYVEPGDTYIKVLDKFSEPTLHAFDLFTILYVKMQGLGSQLKVGEFKIDADSSVLQIINALSEGRNRVYHPITFPEGLTNYQIIEKIKQSPIFCTVFEGVTLQEGAFFPDTYYVERCGDQEHLLQRMRIKQRELLDQLWAARDKALPFKTKEEALILASMIEKETNVADERSLVAGVLLNRLKKRMHLGCDATIIYALTDHKENNPVKRLTYKDLKIDSPYNTYRRYGLPPTPISNPGYASLYAAFHPDKTTYLYYVFDPTQKRHIFSNSLKEHNQNRRKIRARIKAQTDRSQTG